MKISPSFSGVRRRLLQHRFPGSGRVRVLVYCVLALLWVAAGREVPAAVAGTQPASKSVEVSIKRTGQSLSLVLPAGCTSCLLEVRKKGAVAWTRWTVLPSNGKPGSVNVPVPKAHADAEWRATGTVNAEKAQAFAKKSRFPESFYQGQKAFGKTPALGYKLTSSSAGSGDVLGPRVMESVATPSVVSKDATLGATTEKTVESDIWRTDGTLVYFFNQLRGLQVLDIADPASPKLNATLRMPAVGQDMYLLPQTEGSEERLVLLLTRDSGYTQTDIVVVGVSGRVAREVSRTTITGSLADSRMVGRRLYMVTTDWSRVFTAGSTGSTVLSEVLVSGSGEQAPGATFNLAGQAYSAVISAGTGWLSVSTANLQDWNRSTLELFTLTESGASKLLASPVAAAGSVYDKYKVSFSGEVLTVVSLKYDVSAGYTPVSILENFDLSGARLATLEIMRGEQLYATRFNGDKLYAVTFQRTDPLWIVDLSDSRAPKISGHVEVPGFSTYIEPMGDSGEFLFTIGWDSGKVAASLFDVSDVTQPTLRSRVFIDESEWGYSEAVYDEKALKVLPEQGLALIPFTASGWGGVSAGTGRTSFLRLVDISLLNGGSLTLRGHLAHEFSPRRATLVNGILASISQKELITASVEDRDNPVVLAEVALAWPVNQVIQKGDFLLQISDGSSAVWTGERAAVRVSAASSESSVVADIELGEGTVQEAVLRDSKLYVLRRNWNPTLGWSPMVRFVSPPASKKGSSTVSAELALDIYDASALPKLPLLGSVPISTGGTETNCDISRLLWVTDSLAAVITQPKPAPYYYWPWLYMVDDVRLPVAALADAGTGLKMASISPWYPPAASASGKPAVVRPVDVSNPAAPVALRPYPLVGTVSTLLSASAAGDGLLVVGFGQNPVPWRNQKWLAWGEFPQSCIHRLAILDFANPKAPVHKPYLTLPGRLFALGDISRDGFLAFTESVVEQSEGAVRQVQVSVVDDLQVSLFATKSVGTNAVLSAGGAMLFVAEDRSLARYSVENAGVLQQVGGAASLPWAPAELQVRGLSVLGTTGDQLLRVSWPGLDPVQESWKLRQWVSLSRLELGLNRNIYAPMGDFGVEILAPR
jgi:hypothetical protein